MRLYRPTLPHRGGRTAARDNTSLKVKRILRNLRQSVILSILWYKGVDESRKHRRKLGGKPCGKARTTAQQQVLLRSTTEILVRAAEQLYGSGKGQEKLNYVETELERRGYQVDTAAIEAAVRSMNLESGWIQAQAAKTG